MKKFILAVITFAALLSAFASIPDETDRVIAIITLSVIASFITLVFSWDWLKANASLIAFYAIYPVFLAMYGIYRIRYWFRSRNINKLTNEEQLKVMKEHFSEYKVPLGIGA